MQELSLAACWKWDVEVAMESRSKYRGSEELTMLSKSFAGSGQGVMGKKPRRQAALSWVSLI